MNPGRQTFLNKNRTWLESNDIQFQVTRLLPETGPCPSAGSPRNDLASSKMKKRRVEDLVQSHSVGELLTHRNLRLLV